jgi:hypothetical protein
VIRDTFLDEGGWIGITAFPHLWGFPIDPIDLIYISGLKMNVSKPRHRRSPVLQRD